MKVDDAIKQRNQTIYVLSILYIRNIYFCTLYHGMNPYDTIQLLFMVDTFL